MTTQSHLDSSAEQRGVKVKPLEWERARNGDWHAESVIGRYDVGILRVGFAAILRHIDDADAADVILAAGLAAVAAAKAAAQADFDQRILSALLPATPASIRTDALSPEDVFYVSSTASFTDGNNRKVTVLDVVEYGDRFANSWEPRRGILCDLTPDGDAWVLFRDTRKVEVVKWMNLCKVPAIDEVPPSPTKDKDNDK